MTLFDLIPIEKRPGEMRGRVVLAGPGFVGQPALIMALKQVGLEPVFAGSRDEVAELIAEGDAVLVLCHASFSDGRLREVLAATVRDGWEIPLIVCADFYEPRVYLDSMEAGAYDYITYPYDRRTEWVIGNGLREGLERVRGVEGKKGRLHKTVSGSARG